MNMGGAGGSEADQVSAVFLHIPKTAGTSFRDALSRGFGDGAVSPAFPASLMSPSEVQALRHHRIVAGHISITDARRHFPGASLFTIVRDPIQRCLSWYYFARRITGNNSPDVVAARTHDVEAFFALDDGITFRNIFNRQVRQLGDHVFNEEVDLDAALIRAQQTIEDCVWVGRQEHLVSDMERLGDVFPEMDGALPHPLNVTPNRPALPDISPSVVERIVESNRYDLELYAHVETALRSRQARTP